MSLKQKKIKFKPRIKLNHNTAPQGSNLPPSCRDETAQLPLNLPISRAQVFSRAPSVSGRFFMFSAAKASEANNYRNRKREVTD